MDTDVPAAFEMLLEAMSSEKVQLADAVREATLQGRFDEAQRLLTRTQYLERLVGQVRQLREAWDQLESGVWPSVEQKPVMTKEPAKFSDDQGAPELALVDRLFGPRRFGRQRQPVSKTPEREYRMPILEALEELGGRGRAKEILKIVYEKMKTLLTEDDLRSLPTGGIRWRNTAQWERYYMIQEGLLRADSPMGVWEMTEAGRRYLEQNRQQGGEEHKP